ncbi:LacI family DNA-binding transcriptional regulator [Devosia sp. WQ 349]|uniref:LacI family DNA-binding transcriptional regulator n=1 Tax=Devosia sp. WQ 349K1 TaxID=2800329 RepID=UPI0019075AAC|nr:LacI family DNA-binding transcriptional regulator [Devosia sp. WQ 349K1]MBK1793263.1 LacI family DNA-binding transcriptional regulator [Devosia sp. WQ 349K1]
MIKGRGPTIKDVARAAGVSSATVSYVLNDLNKVSSEVDKLVRRVAAELGYTRNNAARALKTGRNNTIGCILPSLTSPIFPEIAQAVQRRAEAHGFATVVVDSGTEVEREEHLIQTLINHGVDGAVALLHPGFDMDGIEHFPLVALDSPHLGLDSIMSDHFVGGRLAAEHLIALGHKRVGYLRGQQELFSSDSRREGFFATAKGRLDIVWEHGVELIPQLPESAIEAIGRRAVTAIACVNDLVAIAALSALKTFGLRVPQDVSVIGFDDMQMSSWPLIDLSTVRQPLDRLGEGAVDLLIQRIKAPGISREDRVVPVSLVPRGSSGPWSGE